MDGNDENQHSSDYSSFDSKEDKVKVEDSSNQLVSSSELSDKQHVELKNEDSNEYETNSSSDVVRSEDDNLSQSTESKSSSDTMDEVKDQENRSETDEYDKRKKHKREDGDTNESSLVSLKEETPEQTPREGESDMSRDDEVEDNKENLGGDNREKHKRTEKSNIYRKHKKHKKQKVTKSVIKESYLDTMAEESEGENDMDDDEEEEYEEEEEDLFAGEIPEELKDFLTDEVVEEEEEEATDVEYEPDKLDEEDLELIAENTGSKWLDDDEEDFKKLRRLKKGTKKTIETYNDQDELWYDDDPNNREFELSDVWATVAECFGQVDLVIQILKNERNPNAVQIIDQDSDYDPQEDPDYDKDTELVQQVEKFKLTESQTLTQDVKVVEQNLEEYVDPDELVREYLTKEDDDIRTVDEPERLYLRYKNRPRNVDERELQNEAQWMSRRLLNEFNIDLSKENVKKAYEQTFQGTYNSKHTSVSSDVTEKCEMLLGWLLNERWEVPFILYHKRHLICPPLTDTIVWRVYQLDLEWVRLNALSQKVLKNIEKIGHEFLPTDILYFSTNFDYLDDLNDVNVHLTYHYPSLYTESGKGDKNKDKLTEDYMNDVGDDYDNKENNRDKDNKEQEQDQEYEDDDIFGDFEPLENVPENLSPSTPREVTEFNMEDNKEQEQDKENEQVNVKKEDENKENKYKEVETMKRDDNNKYNKEKLDRDNREKQEKEQESPKDKELNQNENKKEDKTREDKVEDTSYQLVSSSELSDKQHVELKDNVVDHDDDVMMETDSDVEESEGENDMDDDEEEEDENRSETDELEEGEDNEKVKDRGMEYYMDDGEQKDKGYVKDNELVQQVEKQGTKLIVKKNSAMYLIESVEKLGLDVVCANFMPSPNEFYKVLEKSVVSNPNLEFKVDVPTELQGYNTLSEVDGLDRSFVDAEILAKRDIDFNSIEHDMDLMAGNEDYQIDDFFSAYVGGPYTSGKRVFNALVDYYAKKYSTHISVKRLLRDYFRSYCNITCVTTPKGEGQIEVTDPTWLVRRMAGMPFQRLLRTVQMSYEYPYHFPEKRDRFNYLHDRLRELRMVELYLHVFKLERDGQIDVTIHPLTHNEQPYWKSEQYAQRFQTFYSLYKDLASFVNSQNTGNSNYNNTHNNYNDQLRHMENEKNLIEKENLLLNGLHERDLQFLDNLINELSKVFVKKKLNRNSIWKYFYKQVLQKMINKELIPLFRKEIRELLFKGATNSVLLNCQQFLNYKLDVNQSKENVMCLLNDPEGFNVYMAVVDERSNVVYLNVYKNLLQSLNYNTGAYNSHNNVNNRTTMNTWAQQVTNVLGKFEVKTLLVGLVDLNSLLLFHRVQELVVSKMQNKVGLCKYDTQLPRLVASKYLRTKQNTNYNTNSGMNLQNLNMNSNTGLVGGNLNSGLAGSSLSDMNFYLIMAVSVCRFYINFLFELTGLWSDSGENHLLRVKLHNLQELLPRDRFEQGLLQVMLTSVNRLGVGLDLLMDANWPRKQPHLSALPSILGGPVHAGLSKYVNLKSNVLNYMSFLSGMGVRKAQLLLDKLRSFTPSSRSALTQVLGPLVFLNIASFVRFGQNVTTDSLDTSRIHPTESGFIAEKLCNGSLDEQLSGEEAVQEIMSNPTKLDDLDLEAYSVLLNEKQDMPRMYPYLLFIKNELQNPYSNTSHKGYHKRTEKSLQKEEKERDMSNLDVFYSVLNLDRNSFKSGSPVSCKFEVINERGAKVVLLPLLLRGNVNDLNQFKIDVQKLAKDNPKFNNLTGEVFEARISRIDYEPILENGSYNYRVDVNLTNYQKRHMLNSFLNDLVNQRLDEFLTPLAKYDINKSKLPINAQKKKIQYRRNIRHPAYKMWPLQKVISYLKQAEVPVGECCICPMSEWDRLNLVIKTCGDPFNFATFVIYEKGQRVPGELGKELMLQNEKYNNIDQIIAQFCETLKLNLEEFYTHPKFRHNCELNKVERDLVQESALKPDNITWAIIPPNPKRSHGINHPLRFILVVIPPGFSVISQDVKSLQDPIYVTHKSFKLWTHEEKSLRDLIAWWKEYGYWHRNLERNKYMQEKQNVYNNY